MESMVTQYPEEFDSYRVVMAITVYETHNDQGISRADHVFPILTGSTFNNFRKK